MSNREHAPRSRSWRREILKRKAEKDQYRTQMKELTELINNQDNDEA